MGSLLPLHGAVLCWDGGRLQICTVATNVLNKESRTGGKGWSSIFDIDREIATLHREKNYVTNCYSGSADCLTFYNNYVSPLASLFEGYADV
jgi:hypothetical protein